jgi:hypothetical protein
MNCEYVYSRSVDQASESLSSRTELAITANIRCKELQANTDSQVFGLSIFPLFIPIYHLTG